MILLLLSNLHLLNSRIISMLLFDTTHSLRYSMLGLTWAQEKALFAQDQSWILFLAIRKRAGILFNLNKRWCGFLVTRNHEDCQWINLERKSQSVHWALTPRCQPQTQCLLSVCTGFRLLDEKMLTKKSELISACLNFKRFVLLNWLEDYL